MRFLLFVVLVLFPPLFSSLAQNFPDSLIARVVLLEKIAYETPRELPSQSGYPQATGFFVGSGTNGLHYLVTAKHAVHRPDTVSGTRIHVVGINGRNREYLLGDYRTSPSVLQNQDPLVDLVMIDNTITGVAVDLKEDLSFFQPSDIVGKEELKNMRRGQKVVYIGRWPDPKNPEDGTYQMPQGVFLKAIPEPLRLIDPERHYAFKADFSLRIPGFPGVSGSPVLIRQGNHYRLLGIVSAFAEDANKSMTDVAYCTAAYRILETMESTPLSPIDRVNGSRLPEH